MKTTAITPDAIKEATAKIPKGESLYAEHASL